MSVKEADEETYRVRVSKRLVLLGKGYSKYRITKRWRRWVMSSLSPTFADFARAGNGPIG